MHDIFWQVGNIRLNRVSDGGADAVTDPAMPFPVWTENTSTLADFA
jgi:hypothetical protein